MNSCPHTEEKVSAIYARQSVDRLDSISIESQIEYCEYELRGGAYRVYADKGFSGKNTSRPQFQNMLESIRRGEIRRVVCYRLDRISRSVLDFTTMIDEMQRYGVEFVSCSEKFDTSTPMGRAMLNICIVFAQLERETIQQRVADAYRSRSVKGFYMGGRVPYGYRLTDHMIDGKKTSCYIPEEEEAEIVRQIFKLYAQPQVSMGDVVRQLTVNMSPELDVHWNRARISGLLRNPIYVRADLDVYDFFLQQGACLHNSPEDFCGTNGCYLYKNKDAESRAGEFTQQHVVLAPHEGLVSSELWIRAQRKRMRSEQVAKPVKARNTWLAGKIKCGKCGYALVVKRSRTETGRYFICSRHMDRQGCDGVGGLSAPVIEELVLDAMQRRISGYGTVSVPRKGVEISGLPEIRGKILRLECDIRGWIEKLPHAEGVLMQYINEKVVELDAQIKKLRVEEQRLRDGYIDKGVSGAEIVDCMRRHWEELDISDKMAIADAMIESVRVTKEVIEIRWCI